MSEKKRVLLKLLVLGDSGVGKTALLHKYVDGTFIQEHKATIGADFISKDVEFEDKVVSLQIWDTAGQERFLSLGPSFYRGTDACLLVYDITNAQSFKQIEAWRNSFLGEANLEDSEKFPFVLCGNKCDLEQSRAVSSQDGEKLANQHKMLFFETSALNGKNVNEAVQKIASVGGDSDTVPSIQADIANKALKLDLEELDTKKPPTSAACSC